MKRARCASLLSLLLLLPLALLTACGEEAAPPHVKVPAAPKALSIVSTTPLIHNLVREMVADTAQTQCLLSTPSQLKHGDLAADASMQLRSADLIFMHAAEPFPHLVQTVEAHAPADRVVRLRTTASYSGAPAFSVAPTAVAEMITTIEASLCAADPTNAAHYQRRCSEMRTATVQFAQAMNSQLTALPQDRRVILTNDPQLATVIRGLGLSTVTIDLPLTTHPTQADRETLLAAMRMALAIDAGDSEAIREMLDGIARETGAKIITPPLSPWPADDEDYATWMKRNLEAVMTLAK